MPVVAPLCGLGSSLALEHQRLRTDLHWIRSAAGRAAGEAARTRAIVPQLSLRALPAGGAFGFPPSAPTASAFLPPFPPRQVPDLLSSVTPLLSVGTDLANLPGGAPPAATESAACSPACLPACLLTCLLACVCSLSHRKGACSTHSCAARAANAGVTSLAECNLRRHRVAYPAWGAAGAMQLRSLSARCPTGPERRGTAGFRPKPARLLLLNTRPSFSLGSPACPACRPVWPAVGAGPCTRPGGCCAGAPGVCIFVCVGGGDRCGGVGVEGWGVGREVQARVGGVQVGCRRWVHPRVERGPDPPGVSSERGPRGHSCEKSAIWQSRLPSCPSLDKRQIGGTAVTQYTLNYTLNNSSATPASPCAASFCIPMAAPPPPSLQPLLGIKDDLLAAPNQLSSLQVGSGLQWEGGEARWPASSFAGGKGRGAGTARQKQPPSWEPAKPACWSTHASKRPPSHWRWGLAGRRRA